MARLKAKEFEEACLARMEVEEKLGRGTMGRYGVMSYIDIDPVTRQIKWQPVESLPDLEGVIPPVGRQFIADCKVTSDSGVELRDDHLPLRQLEHMLRRSRFGAICFLLLHYNPRELKTKSEPAETFAFPVYEQHPFWVALRSGAGKRSINRDDCREYGVVVDWNLATEQSRIPRPDILAALWRLMELPIPETIPG